MNSELLHFLTILEHLNIDLSIPVQALEHSRNFGVTSEDSVECVKVGSKPHLPPHPTQHQVPLQCVLEQPVIYSETHEAPLFSHRRGASVDKAVLPCDSHLKPFSAR